MDLVDRILPYIADDDRYDVDDRQGVPGTGPYANPRLRRRGGRKGIGRRRYEMNDRYDDDTDDDVDARRGGRRRRDSRGRFVRSDIDDMRYDDDRYDDVRHTTDEARRTADETRATNPVMRTTDRTARYDDTHGDRRYDITTDDDARRPGPDMRR